MKHTMGTIAGFSVDRRGSLIGPTEGGGYAQGWGQGQLQEDQGKSSTLDGVSQP
jgi:hypothetical protein